MQCINLLSTIVTLAWDEVADDDTSYFAVEQKVEDGSFKEISRAYYTLGANIEKLTPEKTYTFRVIAYDKCGNRGEASDEITVTTPHDTTAPVVIGISPSPGYFNGDIPLRMTVKDDSVVSALNIQTSRDTKNWTTVASLVSDKDEPIHVFSYALNTDSYSEGSVFVRGIATDLAGNVTAEENASYCEYRIDRTAPDVPMNIETSSDERNIRVMWQSPDDDVDHYILYRSEEEDGDYQIVDKYIGALDYYDQKVDQFQTYFYKISAVDFAGNVSLRSQPVSCQVLPDTDVPQLEDFIPVDGTKVGDFNGTITAVFSDNTMIDSNNCYDNNFDVKEINGKLYLTYTQANREFSTETSDLEGFIGAFDVYAAEFNPVTEKFSEPVRLTQNDTYDCETMMTEIGGKPAVVWMNQAENQLLDLSAEHSVMCSTLGDNGWSEPEIVADKVKGCRIIRVGKVGNDSCAAFVSEKDEQLKAADFNRDGQITVADVTALQYAIAEL